jgi:hypothetical protein
MCPLDMSNGHVDGHNGRPMDIMEFSVFVNCVHFGRWTQWTFNGHVHCPMDTMDTLTRHQVVKYVHCTVCPESAKNKKAVFLIHCHCVLSGRNLSEYLQAKDFLSISLLVFQKF